MITQLLAEKYTGALFMEQLLWLIEMIISIAGALFVLYAVYIGYLFAMASDEGKRKAAKNRLMKALSSALIIFALVSVIKVIDVTFGDVKIPESGNDDVKINNSDLVFSYSEPDAAIEIISNTESKFTFKAKNIYLDGQSLKGESIEFKGFIIDECHKLTNYYGSSYWKQDEGELIYYFKGKPNGTGTATIRCYKKGDLTSYYLGGVISFKYGDIENCNVRVILRISNFNISSSGYNFEYLDNPSLPDDLILVE